MTKTLWGFWSQAYRGNGPKLLAFGYGSDSAREAENAFKRMFPSKPLSNLTLTTSYTEAQYLLIAERQKQKGKR